MIDKKPKIVKRFSISDDETPSKKSVPQIKKEPVAGPSFIFNHQSNSSAEDELLPKKFTARKSFPKPKVPVAGSSSIGNHRRRTVSSSDDERSSKKKDKKCVASPIGDRRRSTLSSSDEDVFPRKSGNNPQEPVAGPSSTGNYRRSMDEQPSIKTLPRIPKKSDRIPKDLKRSSESEEKSKKKLKVESSPDSPEPVNEVVCPQKQAEPNYKIQKMSKDKKGDQSSDSGSVYEFVFEEPPCEEYLDNIEIKQEPPEINWNDSHYTQDDDDDDVIIIENPAESQGSHSTSLPAESNMDDEFNLFFSSQREELNNSQVAEDSDSDFDVQPRKPMSEQKKLELFGSSDEDDVQEESGQEESGSGQEDSGSGQDDQEEAKSPEASGSSDEEKKKHEGPVLIDALPLVPRKRGRQSELSTKAKERKEKILRRVSAEDRMNYQRPLKPKAAFTDKMRNLKGQKVVNKNSNWIPDYDPEDKESKKQMREQRMKRLKELSKANKQETEVPKEPEPSTSSAYIEPCVPSREEGSSMVNKIPVKVTKVNRGSFLTELPQKAAKSNAPLDTSVEKIIVDDQVIVIGKKSTVQEAPPQSKPVTAGPPKPSLCPASTPPTSQLAGTESMVAATPMPPPLPSQRMETSVPPPPSQSASERSRKEETVVPKPKESVGPKQMDTVLPVPRREEPKQDKPVLPSVSGAVTKEDAALPSVSNLTLKEETKPKLEERGLPRPIPVLPGRSCLAGRRTSSSSRAPARRIMFNDTLDVHDYLIEEGKLLRPVTQSVMLRHHLLDLDNNTVVSEELQRVMHSILYWNTKWLSQEEQALGVPPPVWRRERIHYTDPQLLAIPAPRCLAPDPDRSVASTKLPWPAHCTTQYGTYEAYHKVWLPLMFLEMWSSVALSSNDPALHQSIFSGELSNWNTEEINRLRRCDTVHLKVPMTQEVAANANAPNHGDIVLITLLQDNSRDALRFFGHVEKRRLDQDPAKNTNKVKLHPENMKPVVAILELDIKLRYRNASHNSTKAQVQVLKHARPTLALMQGLSQLQNSSLRDVILNPNIQNMSHSVPVKRSSPFLPTLREMLNTDLSLEQEQVADSISNLLKCDQPSISVIEGPPGTGKTRTLLAITMRILQENLYAAQNKMGMQPNEAASLGSRLGTRILIVSSNAEAMDVMAYFLDFINSRGKDNQKFKFVVIAKDKELCSEASRRNSLQEMYKRSRIQEDKTEGDDIDWETEVNLIEAKVHQERIEVEQARLHKRHDLSQLEDTLRDLEERLEQAKALGLKPSEVLTQVQQDNKLKSLLRQTQIVVSTINNLAISSMCKVAFNTRCSFQLPICLIDDAHNISEVQSLLPLTFGASKFVLAGDLSLPPATMHCKVGADKLGMAQSLLMRLTKALDFQLRPHHLAQDPKLPYTYLHKNLAMLPNLRYHLLRQQHRMPLELTYLTMFFYEKGRMLRPEHSDKQWPFLPFAVIDHKYCQDHNVGNWRSMEAGLVTNLVRYVQYRVHEQMPTHSTNVVVITVEDIMYEKINYELKMNPRLTPLCNDWVRMVGECFADGNVVILSLGAAHPELTKVMELNYFLQAITRAKNSLYIVGNMDKYKHKAHWRALLNHANKENRCFTVTGTTPFNPRHLEIRSPPVPTHMPHSPPHHRGYAPHHSRGLPPRQRNPTPPFRGRSPPRRRSPPTPHPNYRTTHVRPEPNQNYNLPPSDPRSRAPNPLQDRITNMRQQVQLSVNRNPPDPTQHNMAVNHRPQNQSNDLMPVNTLQSFLSFGGPK